MYIGTIYVLYRYIEPIVGIGRYIGIYLYRYFPFSDPH